MMKLLDSSFGTRGQTTTLSQVCKFEANDGSSELVRIRVESNFYKDQSAAIASVMRSTGWVTLIETPADGWHDGDHSHGHLSKVATRLSNRVEAVLSA